MWQHFLIWNKSNLKNASGRQVQQPFSRCSAVALCKGPVQSQRVLTPLQSHVKHRGVAGVALRAWAHHAVHGDRTHCWVSASWECPHVLWAFFGSCCTPNQWVWNTASEDSRMVLCVLQPLVPIWRLLNHLWIYHLSKALEKGWTACVFLTNHPSVTLTNLSSQIRVTSTDSQVPSALPG